MSKWCRYFNGLMNKTCDLGIRYGDVSLKTPNPDYVPGRWPEIEFYTTAPCFPGRPESVALETCPARSFYTAEEEEQMERESEESIQRFFQKIKDGTCPHCDQPMTKEQAGSCVYAAPCGHRLYQGRIS